MTNNQNQRGFVGLLGLLITTAVIVFLAVKILTQLYQPLAPSGVEGADPGLPSQARSIIDSAEEAKRAIEGRDREI